MNNYKYKAGDCILWDDSRGGELCFIIEEEENTEDLNNPLYLVQWTKNNTNRLLTHDLRFLYQGGRTKTLSRESRLVNLLYGI